MYPRFNRRLIGYRQKQVREELKREEKQYRKLISECQSELNRLQDRNEMLSSRVEALEKSMAEQSALKSELIRPFLEENNGEDGDPGGRELQKA